MGSLKIPFTDGLCLSANEYAEKLKAAPHNGAKDPPKPAVPTQRCCLKSAGQHPAARLNRGNTSKGDPFCIVDSHTYKTDTFNCIILLSGK